MSGTDGLRKRAKPAQDGQGSSNGVTSKLSSSNDRNRLLTYDESLAQIPWQTDNRFIRKGYRRHCKTLKGACWSAIAYLHNETVNIHTHFLGALFYAALVPLHFSTHLHPDRRSDPYAHYSLLRSQLGLHTSSSGGGNKIPLDPLNYPRPQTIHDTLALGIFLCSAVGCLSLSAWFHCMQCRSKAVCDRAHKGDYVGIVVLIVGSFWPSLYHGFRGQPIWQCFYIGTVTTLGVGAAWTVLAPGRRSSEQIWHRTLTFIGLGLSAVFPVIHILVTRGLEMARKEIGLDYLAGGGLCYIVGACLYAGRIPERISPGSFDYFFSSHQIFHCLVLAGSFCHYRGILHMALR